MTSKTFELRQSRPIAGENTRTREPLDTPTMLGVLAKISLKLCLFLVFFSVILTAIYRWLPVPVTPLMMIRLSEAVLDGKPIQLDKSWTDFSSISPRMQEAVMAGEDMKFYQHHGFDWEAIDHAFDHNERHHASLRGASTISQQVAKNVFLWPDRSWLRKGLEAYFTILIETFWSKARIMEVYLNVVEFGDGVYGVEAASEKYFAKPASRLTGSEASLLAAILPSPRHFSPLHPTAYVRFRQSLIEHRLRAANEAISEAP
jgi:monofunctional biosynthetic peptidoglycan transglycosylase